MTEPTKEPTLEELAKEAEEMEKKAAELLEQLKSGKSTTVINKV